MNEKALKTLEYTKIIDQLTEYASTEMGKQMCRELQPSCDSGDDPAESDGDDRCPDARPHEGSSSFGGVKDAWFHERLEIGSSWGSRSFSLSAPC